jgi:hypothetical protein
MSSLWFIVRIVFGGVVGKVSVSIENDDNVLDDVLLCSFVNVDESTK